MCIRDRLSSTPARYFGWFATIPTDCPLKRAKPMMIFLASVSYTHLAMTVLTIKVSVEIVYLTIAIITAHGIF